MEEEEEEEDKEEEENNDEEKKAIVPFPNISSRTEEDNTRKKVGNDIPPTPDA